MIGKDNELSAGRGIRSWSAGFKVRRAIHCATGVDVRIGPEICLFNEQVMFHLDLPTTRELCELEAGSD